MHWLRRHNRGRPPHPDVLTPAEWRVLEHVREGVTNAEIAVRMGVSTNTVKTHVARILAKTGMPDRHALAEWDGRPSEASRVALGRGFALPLGGWFTRGAALTGAKAAAGGVASVVFVVSVFAAYGFFFAEVSEENRLVPEPPITRVIDVGPIDDFEVGEVHTFALAAGDAVDASDVVIHVDGTRYLQRTDEQIRDLHDPPFGFFVVRSDPDDVIALAGQDPRTGCALLRWAAEDLIGRSDEAARQAPEGEGIFADPCHGSVYTTAGVPYFGPSAADLHRYPVEVTATGRVLVDLSHQPDPPILGKPAGTAGATPQPDDAPIATPTRAVPPSPFAPVIGLDGRSSHTATLLDDGTVLIAGGSRGSGLTAEAEVYDPRSETTQATGSLAIPRQTHTATKLPDGRVLIVGGVREGGAAGALAEIEVYDPQTGTFEPGGSLHSARLAHAAVGLADGRVVIIGGVGLGEPPRDVEVIDPATRSVTVLSVASPGDFDMPDALLLDDDSILVVGGGRAALLDVAAGTFEEIAVPEGLQAWPAHSVRLSDGRVLVAGGCCDGVDTLAHAAIFDPSARAGRAIAPMAEGRINQRMTRLPGGRVLVTGGLANAGHGFGEGIATAEVFDPATESFLGPITMPEAHTTHTATLLPDGSVLIVGADGSPATRYAP